MNTKNEMLNTFIANSLYSATVDKKKLAFIFSAIIDYANKTGKSIKSLHILEVGCGSGGITIPLTTLGCQIRAFDLDRDAIGRIQSIALQNNLQNLVVSVDDGQNFFDDQHYDIVIASEVFEHVMMPELLAESIVKRMLDGGYLIVTTPNGFGPWELFNRINITIYLKKWNFIRRIFRKPLYKKGSGVDHCQFYTQSRLVRLFTAHQLKLVKSANSDFILSIFGRLLKKNPFLGKLDTKVADVLPAWAVSGWYFVFILAPDHK